ncbi:hypothetical protein Cgig2_017837 [Carnegiea gigantea]|uniref:Uncharacterized protein n=1 Tax=Carnegiea gigantea TaxID=171969 RepID=A0A9Q1KZ38_9CARY|nr:hypothetical protein Cgig2_017837 [Carnegiea gigantea]
MSVAAHVSQEMGVKLEHEVYNDWKACDYGTMWCYENYVQVRSMRRARDIREQLEGLLERVEIEPTSSLNDLEAIKKAIIAGSLRMPSFCSLFLSFDELKDATSVHCLPDYLLTYAFATTASGFLPDSTRLQKNGSYRTIKHSKTVYLRPSSSLAQKVTELKSEWLVEIAPHYYQLKALEQRKCQRAKDIQPLHEEAAAEDQHRQVLIMVCRGFVHLDFGYDTLGFRL